jgi:hypothetical protein
MHQPSLTLSIARDFSTEPIGRYRSDSNVSGEAFCLDKLVPALERAQTVVVVLDGSEGYGSSFLEEAFGGLVRRMGMSADEFGRRVQLISEEDPTLLDEIKGYVEDAARRANRG